MATPMSILFFDVETAPRLSHHWRMYKENIAPSQALKDPFMFTWAAKWRGQKRVRSARLKSGEATAQDDARIVCDLAELMREADIVIAHNVRRFDLPVVNTRLLKNGLEPLDVPRTLDTLHIARQNFAFATNNLDNIARELGVGRKIKTDFELWADCYMGSNSALEEMERYNKQDVELLEDVFEAMLPYASKGVGRLVRAERPREKACPYCGSEHTWGRGWHDAPVNTYQKRQCQDCGKYFRHFSAQTHLRLAYNSI